MLVVLTAVSLVGLLGCGSGGSGGEKAPAPKKADYAVTVTVEPRSVTVPSSDEGVNVVFTVTNSGEKADTYSLQFQALGVPWAPEGIPTSLELPPGGSEDLDVPLSFDVGGNVPGFEVALTATSQGDTAVKDSAACKLSMPK